MSTAVETTPTPKPAPWYWTSEDRARAAKKGWERRRGTYQPTPHERFMQAIADADPGLLRLYVADVAEAAQGHYRAQFPGDLRTIEAIALARRYAAEDATEQERGKALTALVRRSRELVAPYTRPQLAADAALQAAAFTLTKRLEQAARWGLYWSDGAAGADDIDYGRHLPALDALKRR